MLNKERVRLLITALRSKKYRQGRYALNQYDKKAQKRKLCCLGVACEVARLAGLEVQTKKLEDGTIAYDGDDATLPLSVMAWYGFEHRDPMLRVTDNNVIHASIANDYSKLTYSQIAAAFERTYLGTDQDG